MKEPPLTVRVSEYQFLCYLLKDPDPESPLNLASLTLLLRIFTARVWHCLSQQELPWKEQCPFHCPFLSAGSLLQCPASCCSPQAPLHPSCPSASVSPCAIFISYIVLCKNNPASHPRTLIHIYRRCSWLINFIDFFQVPLSKWSHNARLVSKPAGTLLYILLVSLHVSSF